MTRVNEWLCRSCGLVYGSSNKMTLQEANDFYGVIPDAVSYEETQPCIQCENSLVLVPRYNDYEFAILCGQLPLFGPFQDVALRIKIKNVVYRVELRLWNMLARTGLVKHHWF